MNKERFDTEFKTLCFSIIYKMQSTITGRIDKIINVTLLILGSSIFGGLSAPTSVYIGFIIAMLIAIQMTYGFSTASEIAKQQYKEYINLYENRKKYSDEELIDFYSQVSSRDTATWHTFQYPAILRSRIMTGLPVDNFEPTLTTFEKVVSWIAGDLPKRRINIKKLEEN